MIEKNVIEAVCSGVHKASTAIVLTHNIDFLFIESILLPRLRDIGSPQLTIFADAACAANTFRTQEHLVTKLGTRYRVVAVDLGTARRFHPKAIFLHGDASASLVVGSGNATHGGWSSNQEVWSDFLFPGDGGPEIAAFIPYLERILSYVPSAEHIKAETLGNLTEASNSWYSTLSPPGGLAWTPGAKPLFDQILDVAGREVASIDILSPYFDPSATALSRLAALSQGSVRVFLQPRRAGLSRDLAASLPANVRLQTIEADAEERRYKFIHAKSYMIQTPTARFLITGSANCSSAALLADDTWGNAELVSIQAVNEQDIVEFWSRHNVTDGAPPLPHVHPSEEWAVETTELRVLSARKRGEKLEVFFKTPYEIAELRAHTRAQNSEMLPAYELCSDLAIFIATGMISSIWLSATLLDGTVVVSAPSWVDDERALSVGGAERSLRERLESAAARGSLLGGEFLAVLELFDQHIQKPSADRGSRPSTNDHPLDLSYFSEDDIYTDSWPTASPLFSSALASGGFNEADALALIHSFFQTQGEAAPQNTPPNGQSDEDSEGEDQEPEDVQRVQVAQNLSTAAQRFGRLFMKIENSLAHPEYVASRSPARLSSDISALAILMIFARLKGGLSPADYRTRTMAMWNVLFFGASGNDGVVPRHLGTLPEPERSAAILELRSAKLTAAMAAWCMIDWANADNDARRFRFGAAELASRHCWLSEGGDRETVLLELDRIATKLMPDHRDELMSVWQRWLRDGHAMAAFRAALSAIGQRKLAEASSRKELRKGELVWQSGKGFCVIAADLNKSMSKNASLMSVDREELIKVRSEFVAPVSGLLHGEFAISDNVKRQIADLINELDGQAGSVTT
ncbi:hypothetical protein [Agrobacterium fabrum]|uniref:Phospholipase D-like domain-containing protein n=1 Tax=Agrobacterium fabrum TaxID=1176649 RepID=A0A7Z7FT01_9HYPH|nr:hypothetical protein [Agrobacterium fabrum]MCR6727085.1 hypothetical protein [Agrobacterium fabrum]SDK03100.1 hypothetical protein SAMN05428983_3685 [Agrobacterium fabrum]